VLLVTCLVCSLVRGVFPAGLLGGSTRVRGRVQRIFLDAGGFATRLEVILAHGQWACFASRGVYALALGSFAVFELGSERVVARAYATVGARRWLARTARSERRRQEREQLQCAHMRG
jgi:hypothetical protein